MAEDKTTDVIQEVKDMTTEEKAAAWANWVRSEINAALDIFLPASLVGNVNVKYVPHVIETLESGPVLDETKADGVLLSIVFEFEKPIDLAKPRL